MKKSFFIISLISIFSLVACKKDRVCECTVNGTTDKVTMNDATKRQAKDACVSTTYELGNGNSVKIECKLK